MDAIGYLDFNKRFDFPEYIVVLNLNYLISRKVFCTCDTDDITKSVSASGADTVNGVIDQIKHLVTPDMEQGACESLCKSVVAGLGSLVCPTACSTLVGTING
uniref:Uncharacterized protein n=1 Tax=Magallana gigas TaxID=29159 RepID=K1QRH5_MAGGI